MDEENKFQNSTDKIAADEGGLDPQNTAGGNGKNKKPKKKMSKKKKILIIAVSVLVVLGVAVGVVFYIFLGGHVHNMKYNIAVPATCTEEGNSAYYYCEDCGKYFSDFLGEIEISYDSTRIPATGHDMTYRTERAATCTEEGYTVSHYYCSNCGLAFEDEEGITQITDYIIAPLGHDFSGEGKVTLEPDCGEGADGVMTYYCQHTGCGVTREESIPAEHNFPEGTYTADSENELEHYTACTACGAEKDGTRGYHDFVTDSSVEECQCGAHIEYSSDLEFTYADGSYTVVGIGDFTGKNLFIPAIYNDGVNGEHNVTAISARAFWYNNNINTVRLPSTVTSIGDEAFMYCTGLRLVTLSADLSSIGEAAFYGCGGLKSVTIPAGVEYIGAQAFCQTGLETAVFLNTTGWSYGGEEVPASTIEEASDAAALLKREDIYSDFICTLQ